MADKHDRDRVEEADQEIRPTNERPLHGERRGNAVPIVMAVLLVVVIVVILVVISGV